MATTLPPTEVEYLGTLHPHRLRTRIAHLHDAGWSLRALGEALDPPRARTTVHYWVRTTPRTPVMTPALPLPPSVRLPGGQARTISPRVPPEARSRLSELAREARKYRAGTSPTASSARANAELTATALRLREFGVPTADIADAAGVSYRAMAKRIANARS
jgi:hypothetical protein